MAALKAVTDDEIVQQGRFLSDDEWDSFEADTPTPKRGDWDDDIENLMAGHAIMKQVSPDKVKGTRIGIARRAASTYNVKGITFKYSTKQQVLAMRLVVKRNDSVAKK